MQQLRIMMSYPNTKILQIGTEEVEFKIFKQESFQKKGFVFSFLFILSNSSYFYYKFINYQIQVLIFKSQLSEKCINSQISINILVHMKKTSNFQQLEQQEIQQSRVSQNNHNQRRHYGANLIISLYPDGEPRFMLGPHFYIFFVALFALSVLLVMLLVTVKDKLTTVWYLAMCICGLIFFLSYLNIGFSNPGLASTSKEPSEQDKKHARFCKPCKIVRREKIYHCFDCDVCIQGYDHHCPWIGKCVGKNNLKSFYFFLFMTFGTLIMCFVSTIASNGLQSNSPNIRAAGPQVMG